MEDNPGKLINLASVMIFDYRLPTIRHCNTVLSWSDTTTQYYLGSSVSQGLELIEGIVDTGEWDCSRDLTSETTSQVFDVKLKTENEEEIRLAHSPHLGVTVTQSAELSYGSNLEPNDKNSRELSLEESDGLTRSSSEPRHRRSKRTIKKSSGGRRQSRRRSNSRSMGKRRSSRKRGGRRMMSYPQMQQRSRGKFKKFQQMFSVQQPRSYSRQRVSKKPQMYRQVMRQPQMYRQVMRQPQMYRQVMRQPQMSYNQGAQSRPQQTYYGHQQMYGSQQGQHFGRFMKMMQVW
nr:uncharacterized protein LOC128701899 [Cherax quadricarinatus]